MFYGLVFFLALVVAFVTSQFGERAVGTVAMSEAALPVVMMQTDDGQVYNRLYGYTAKIDETRLNTEITIVPQDLQLPVVIDTYNETIQTVAYKIRAKSDYSLIENTTLDEDEYEIKDNQVYATFNIKNLIRDEEEYYLEVILKTDKYETISYYTTIMKDTGFKLNDKIAYVLKFNACTLDENRLSEIAGNLETSKNADNSNYGKVDITNSKAMVGWGDLKPTVESNIVPSVYMVDDEVAVVTLDYTVGVSSGEDRYDVFTVHEFYRVRQANSKFYLLNYDRQATQIFDGKSDLISTGKINVGIAPDVSVNTMADKDNKFIYFENSGALWCFDREMHRYSKVFAFESDDSDNVRERYNAHEIKIMSVGEDGSVYFLVYGYMNRGAHEGQVGVSLCRYIYADNEVHEELYIPVDVPASVLCNNVGEIAYVTATNSIYIKIDEILYQIDLASKETMTEIKGLTTGNYCISENGEIIAYAVDGSAYGSDSIRVFNIAAGTDYYINAAEGEKVKALGFIVNDFIYGMGKESDVIKTDDGNTTYAMYKIALMNGEFQEIRNYEPKGYYITDATVDDYRINLFRVTKNEHGQFVSASIDQLINREENVKTDDIVVETITTKDRLTQVVITVPQGFDGSNSSTIRKFMNVEYKNDSEFDIPEKIQGADKYYIRGFGSYISSYSDVKSAIIAAHDRYGRVYDSDNNLIWKRFKAASSSISGLKSPGCDKQASYEAAKKIVSDYAIGKDVEWIKLDNIALDYVLSFVDLQAPVIANTLNGYVIITGYTSKEVTYLNTMNGQSVTVSNSDAAVLFSQAGNSFVTFYRK